jgi:hypothetical protein
MFKPLTFFVLGMVLSSSLWANPKTLENVEIMNRFASVYGPFMDFDDVVMSGHEDVVKPIQFSDLNYKSVDVLTGLFVVVEESGFLHNAVDFAILKNSINMKGLKPIILKNELEDPKIFGVFKGDSMVGVVVNLPAETYSTVESGRNPEKSLYMTAHGKVIKIGSGAKMGRTARKKAVDYNLSDLNKVLEIERISSKSCNSIL